MLALIEGNIMKVSDQTNFPFDQLHIDELLDPRIGDSTMPKYLLQLLEVAKIAEYQVDKSNVQFLSNQVFSNIPSQQMWKLC
jgi:hypothetical protein